MTLLEEREPSLEEQARDKRLAASEGREDLVEIPEGCTVNNVCNYLGVNRQMVFSVTKRHGAELRSVGYLAGTGATRSSFSRRSVLHVAMLLPAKVAGKPRELREKLGVWVERKPPLHDTTHLGSCRAAIEKAIEMAGAVREQDPADNWSDLGRLDRWQLHAVIVALASMVGEDKTTRQLTSYLLDISRIYRDTDANPAHGLLKLTPPRPRQKEERCQSITATTSIRASTTSTTTSET